MKFDDLKWDKIIMEAPGDEVVEDEELSATDYTDTDNLEISEADPNEELGPEDYTAQEDDVETEDDLDAGDDLGEGDDLGTDDTDTGLEDESIDDEQTDNSVEDEVVSDSQNKYLIHDFIELYNRIDEIENMIIEKRKNEIYSNPVFNKVKENMNKLKDLTYDYITDKFINNSYVANLYQFNLIIQALNINVQMIESINKEIKKSNGGKKKKRTQK